MQQRQLWLKPITRSSPLPSPPHPYTGKNIERTTTMCELFFELKKSFEEACDV